MTDAQCRAIMKVILQKPYGHAPEYIDKLVDEISVKEGLDTNKKWKPEHGT